MPFRLRESLPQAGADTPPEICRREPEQSELRSCRRTVHASESVLPLLQLITIESDYRMQKSKEGRPRRRRRQL